MRYRPNAILTCFIDILYVLGLVAVEGHFS